MGLKNFFNKIASKANASADFQPWNNVEEKPAVTWDDLEEKDEDKTTWDDLKNLDDEEQAPAAPEKLEQLEVDGFIDTENPETIQKYKDNLNFLAAEIKKNGRQDKFMLIRDDDNFPHGYKWELASAFTQTEQIKNPLTTAIRRAIARQNHPETQQKAPGDLSFMIPGLVDNSEQIRAEADQLDPSIGAVFGPAHFRSTKHFTINTALGHTGSYNAVESNRNFTIIDTIDNFKDSPYRYSLAYEDAYVDTTHEQLEISKNAAILISKERYEEIKNDEALMAEIAERKLVVYSGDESTAINMYLTEQGIFPNNAGMKFHDYDPELNGILDQSIKDLATETGTPFGLGHGNINGAGGHFSSFFDDHNQDFRDWQRDFLTALSDKFPDNEDAPRVMSNYEAAERFVSEVGIENVEKVLQEINQNYLAKAQAERERYYEERENMSAEDKQLMQSTVQHIREYFKDTKDYVYGRSEVYGPIQIFYQSKSLKEQIEAARQINQFFDQNLV